MRVCGKRLDTEQVVTVSIADGKIDNVEVGIHEPEVGGGDLWLSPGFCDIQINGYSGRDFNLGVWGPKSGDQGAQKGAIEKALYDLRKLLAASGTVLFCPTITTNSSEAICESLAAIAAVLDKDPVLQRSIPGIHLEGPFIAPEDGPRGAHPLEFVSDPNWDDFQRWQDASGGRIQICTLAPERPGALPFIGKLAETGVIVAIGHTGADPEDIRCAADAGARLSTHLGNGAHHLVQRHPNYIWEQLAEDRLAASIIADGHHLPASVAKCIARVKRPGKLLLVSDAVSLGGLPPGLYYEGRFEVQPSGKITLAGTPYLAGAGHLLDTGVANAVHFTDLTLNQAVACVTVNPAFLLGHHTRKGQIAVEFDADLTLFRRPQLGKLEIAAAFCAGERLH